MHPDTLRALALFWSNVDRNDLEREGVLKAGANGGSDWGRFNDDPMTFIIKLPRERLDALADLIRRRLPDFQEKANG